MELYQLKTFVSVAQTGSITRAAEQLYISQPAISAHIKAMEESLGLSLFERTPKGMRLTQSGRTLLLEAEKILQNHQAFLATARQLKDELAGTLHIGTGMGVSAKLIGPFISQVSLQYPEVTVSLQQCQPAEMHHDLHRGALDGCFYNEAATPDPRLDVIDIGEFGIFVAAPAGLINFQEPMNWEKLVDIPWISPGPDTCCGQAAATLFEKYHFQPKKQISIDREEVTRTLIAGGVGIGLLHSGTARDAQLAGEIDIICAAQPLVRIVFASLKSRYHDPVLTAFRKILIKREC